MSNCSFTFHKSATSGAFLPAFCFRPQLLPQEAAVLEADSARCSHCFYLTSHPGWSESINTALEGFLQVMIFLFQACERWCVPSHWVTAELRGTLTARKLCSRDWLADWDLLTSSPPLLVLSSFRSISELLKRKMNLSRYLCYKDCEQMQEFQMRTVTFLCITR